MQGIILMRHRPFLFISLLAALVGAPLASWAQITTMPAAVGAVATPIQPRQVRSAKAPDASSDLPILALLGLGLLLTGAGMVNSIRPSRNRA